MGIFTLEKAMKHTLEQKKEILKKFKESKVSVRSFCRGEKITASTLYRWIKELEPKETGTKDTDKPKVKTEIFSLEEKLNFLENQIYSLQKEVFTIACDKITINKKLDNHDSNYDFVSKKISTVQKDLEKLHIELLKKFKNIYKYSAICFFLTSVYYTILSFIK